MKTKKIFDTDAYVTQKDVTILECVKSERKGYEKYFEVITDETIFSPEGGGQSADLGTIDGIKVFDVQEIDGEIIHFLEKKIAVNKNANEEIDELTLHYKNKFLEGEKEKNKFRAEISTNAGA